jgi:hypothetical protein
VHSTRTTSLLALFTEGPDTAGKRTLIETKTFGKKTEAEALGRILTHTAHHAGQIGIVTK